MRRVLPQTSGNFSPCPRGAATSFILQPTEHVSHYKGQGKPRLLTRNMTVTTEEHPLPQMWILTFCFI